MSQSKNILQSWEANAQNWISTIDNNELESRRLVTNSAIVNTVLRYSPKTVLDLGCGEGWLSRALREKGLQVWGVDAVQTFIDVAIERDGGYYFHNSYEQIIEGRHRLPSPFDVIVINFALLDKDVSEKLLACLHWMLRKGGSIIIQTLHPFNVGATEKYVSGWKEGSWNGMSREFVLPYQWYFRTLEDWIKLFSQTNYSMEELVEPVHPQTAQKNRLILFLSWRSAFLQTSFSSFQVFCKIIIS